MAETPRLHYLVPLLFFLVLVFAKDEQRFVYNGFQGPNLHLEWLASILSYGLLQRTTSLCKKMAMASTRNPSHSDQLFRFQRLLFFPCIMMFQPIEAMGLPSSSPPPWTLRMSFHQNIRGFLIHLAMAFLQIMYLQ